MNFKNKVKMAVNKKSNPLHYIQQQGIDKERLSAQLQEAIEEFEQGLADLRGAPDYMSESEVKNLTAQAESLGSDVLEWVKEEEAALESEQEKAEKTAKQKAATKARSESAHQKAAKLTDEIAYCKEQVREWNKKHRKPPKRKSLIEKLTSRLPSLLNLMPDKLKKDDEVVRKTGKLFKKFINELKDLWELNKIVKVEEAVEAKVVKLEAAAKKEEEKAKEQKKAA